MNNDCKEKKEIAINFTEFNYDNDCPIDWSSRFMSLISQETCGQDVMCREGTLQVYTILDSISKRKGLEDDIDLIIELLRTIKESVNCEMTMIASEKCLSVIEDNYDRCVQHISQKKCSQLVCSGLVDVYISPEKCTGCMKCKEVCPVGAISGSEKYIHIINQDVCDSCFLCVDKCPEGAIKKSSATAVKVPAEPVEVGSWETESLTRRRRRR